MKPAHSRHRADRGSAELIELLKASGVGYEGLGGAIDGVIWFNGRSMLVDFKHDAKAPLTERQGKLLARGCPIAFLWDAAGVRAVVQFLKREAA